MAPASTILQTADAVVAALNTGGLLPGVTAVRAYAPQYELKDMGVLHVTVVPKAMVEQIESRQDVQYDCAIDVAVQKKARETEAVELDTLLDLVQALAKSFRLKRLDTFKEACWIRTEHLALFDPEHLVKLRQFTGVFTLTFRVIE